jgi:hypothetical protein
VCGGGRWGVWVWVRWGRSGIPIPILIPIPVCMCVCCVLCGVWCACVRVVSGGGKGGWG